MSRWQIDCDRCHSREVIQVHQSELQHERAPSTPTGECRSRYLPTLTCTLTCTSTCAQYRASATTSKPAAQQAIRHPAQSASRRPILAISAEIKIPTASIVPHLAASISRATYYFCCTPLLGTWYLVAIPSGGQALGHPLKGPRCRPLPNTTSRIPPVGELGLGQRKLSATLESRVTRAA